MTAPDPYLTAIEIADYLNVSRHTALRWMHNGSISSFRDGRNIRARRSAVDAFIAANTTRRTA